MLCTRLMLADAIVRPGRPQSPSGTNTSSGRCTQRAASSTREVLATAPSGHGRVKRLAREGWGLVVLSEERKVTAKLHGPLPGLHQDITLAESVAFLWYVRHIGALFGTFYTDP